MTGKTNTIWIITQNIKIYFEKNKLKCLDVKTKISKIKNTRYKFKSRLDTKNGKD